MRPSIFYTPFYDKGRLSARFAGALQVVETGDVFAGAGISGVISLNNDWFIEKQRDAGGLL